MRAARLCDMEKHIASTIGGLVGGAVGTALMQQGMKLTAKLPESMQPPMKGDPADFMVQQLEKRRERRLPEPTRERAKQSLHWLYGIGWASALSLLGPELKMRRLGRAVALGAALGAGVWAVGYLGWLPRAGLMPPVREQRPGHHATGLLSHVAYGIVSALPIFGANRLLADPC